MSREIDADAGSILAIAGTGQNGATLLCRMLGELPGVVAVGEIGRLWEKGLVEDVACSCGERFSDCPFWTEVGLEAFGGWDRLDLKEVRRLALALPLGHSRWPHPFALPLIAQPKLSRRYTRDLEAYADLMRRLYGGVLTVSGADVIVDSMKIPAHIYLLARADVRPTRFVQLVRDPRGVAYSNMKEVPRQGSRADKPMRTTRTPRKTASKWLWFNASFEALRRAGHPFIRLRYEDLVRDPCEAVRRCAAHAGLDPTETDLSFIDRDQVRLSAGHLVAGNRMRNAAGPITIRLDEAWRDRMAPRDQRTVEFVTSPLFRRYGYRRGPRS
jgi:hypothetical protein